ncbi:MAG TPA: ATP-dependent zinc metalloprotease FtsH [Candidatus Omnitrophica bacterium]|nr:MAG: cell division protein FtsH [Candidatus Omnitrophota bacterium]RKY43927.1 MAG: cell division protein FtsH [Candidatus Omnitrophota bacterium]HEC68844.1 ATP-dependent zinc metalloprotease FtsH [Candidatus Omnitrophota bacterium]
MQNRFPKDKKNFNQKTQHFRSLLIWVLAFFIIAQLISLFSQGIRNKEYLSYSQFYRILKENKEHPQISFVRKIENKIEGRFITGKEFQVYVPEEDEELLTLLKKNVENFEIQPPQTFWAGLFYSLAPIFLFIIFLWYFAYRGSKQVGGSLWSFGKVRARLIEQGKTQVTFQDVAGVDEAKEELQEVIEFLKDPKRFQRLGGKIPKGVLLVGPPGCGKTLLAKAVAGEADVPFYSISGSDFVELFVGVGASRVRDLFEQAKKAAKISGKGCIIFIDEIDAVGRLRFAGIGGGHDEREQTLNQLLVEMDGFEPNEGIIVMAATNRPDVLDPALLRPGRFDRHIVIDRPDIKGREQILKVHTKKIKLDPSVDLTSIARQTPGFSGADLANLCNEAALLAARRNKKAVGKEEMEEAIERVMAGPQRKSRIISKKEKEIVAVHESGHALLSVILPEVDPLHKVSIIPRGIGALGYTMQLPLQDRYIMTKQELFSRICVLLGGRVAESLLLKEISTGAENDLRIATDLARKMVVQFGMSPKLGHLTLERKEGPIFLGRDLVEHKDYSEETARLIDEEVKRIIDEAYSQSEEIIKNNLEKLRELSQVLLEKEILEAEEVKKILKIEEEDKNASPSS